MKTLDIGPYPLTRVTYQRPAGIYGGLVESMRMSEAVVPVSQLDPTLTVGRGGGVIQDDYDAVRMGGLAEATRPVLVRDRLLAGYSTAGSDQRAATSGSATVVHTAVLRFADDATAQRASADVEQADFDVAPTLNQRLSLADYTAAHIHWRPGVPTVGAFLAHGDFVLCVYVQRPLADPNDLLAWIHKVFAAQVPALDKFRATATRDLPNLRVDAEGMLARSMTRYRDEFAPDPITFAVYGPLVLAEGSADADVWWREFQSTGADLVSFMNNDVLIRARDAKAALSLMDWLRSLHRSDYVDEGPPAHVPGARCLVLKGSVPGYWANKCYVAFGRYVSVVNDPDKTVALQRTAAEYALLANSF